MTLRQETGAGLVEDSGVSRGTERFPTLSFIRPG